MIEIGSGHGEMTQHLLARALPSTPSKSIRRSFPGLAASTKIPQPHVVPGDILEADLAAIASGRRIRIYGNLPYYITSPIFIASSLSPASSTNTHRPFNPKLLFASRLNRARATTAIFPSSPSSNTRPRFVFEFLATRSSRRRKSPPPPSTLRLPANAQSSLGSSASSAAGAPADSSLDDASRFLDFVKLCFSQKRKTLVNNLRSLAKPDRVREALATLKLRPDSRAEQLPVAQLARASVSAGWLVMDARSLSIFTMGFAI